MTTLDPTREAIHAMTPVMETMMRKINDTIWTVPAPLTFYGLRVNTRMTVCQCPDGGSILISPIAWSPELGQAIDALGPVRALVSPNLLHHLFLGDWCQAYPNALSFGPPGLAQKRQDLNLDHELDDHFDALFGEALLRIPIAGMPRLNESLFFHRRSKTLIATDFCFHLPDATGLTGMFATVSRVKTQTRCEPLFLMLVRDRETFRASLKTLRSLDIEHLSMCHHSVLTEGAKAALSNVLDQLGIEPG